MKGHFANSRKLWDILLSLGLRSVLQLLAEPHVGFIFFALLFVVLLLRPQGLLGRAVVQKV
jgi:branched-subunit amino acid ABC-type transport system permease component